MSGRVLIVGQGLAGTALGLELETRGIDFLVASDPAAASASRVAAGLVNPVTGQRWTKSAHVDALLPVARAAYARWEETLGVRLWHPLALTRWWRDGEERDKVAAKIERGELAPYATAADLSARGVEIAAAAWVDLPALLDAAARRWRTAERLREARVELSELEESAGGVTWRGEKFSAAVLCVGAGALVRESLARVAAVTLAKGELLTVRGARLAPHTALSRGTWLLVGPGGVARVGATYERGRDDLVLTETARRRLLADAREFTGDELEVTAHTAGVRLATADRLPLAGWYPERLRLGVLGALGSKGALWAPALAAAWCAVLAGDRGDFPPEASVRRRGLRG
jgi:glycine/D-amino acid oxidase-like deaminating enzyme